MARNIAVGIDIGTRQIKVMVAERISSRSGDPLEVLGTGMARSEGLRHGYVVNKEEVAKALRGALNQAEKSSGMKIKSSYLGMGGVTLEGLHSEGAAIISRADSEITDLDVAKAINDAERNLGKEVLENKRILHTIPLEFRIDGKKLLGRPQGLKAGKLEVKILSITYLEQHLNDLAEAVEEAGVEVRDVVASPIAESLVTLTKTEKIAGCLLANIGAETVSLSEQSTHFPEGLPYRLK
jgi:cell division protein FtsA